jgi:hypothetical protein
VTDQKTSASPRRRGRPCKEPPWLREVAEAVGRGTPLRRVLWSKNIMFTERELKNLYRLKKFREYYETAKIDFYREWGRLPRRSHTRPGERFLAALSRGRQIEHYVGSR